MFYEQWSDDLQYIREYSQVLYTYCFSVYKKLEELWVLISMKVLE